MAQPTMADIAERLGISRPLVSIVLRDVPGASAQTRERVWQAARELGYTPHQAARSLRQTRSLQLGVTFDPAHASEPEIVEAIYAAASEHGYQLLLSARTSARDQRRALDELLSYRCAALLQVGSELTHRQLTGVAERAGVPTVLVAPGRRNDAYDVVHSDGRAGISAVTAHLLDLGHRHLAYVHAPSLPGAADRLRGFHDAVSAARAREEVSAEVVEVTRLGYTEEAGSEAARRLLGIAPGPLGRFGELPTGMVAGNDQQAVGALWVLLRAGIDVPGQMSVAGYDDTRYAKLSAVDLTTASQDTAALGRHAVDAVIRRIEQPDLTPQLHQVSPRLVLRGSTSSPAAQPTPRSAPGLTPSPGPVGPQDPDRDDRLHDDGSPDGAEGAA